MPTWNGMRTHHRPCLPGQPKPHLLPVLLADPSQRYGSDCHVCHLVQQLCAGELSTNLAGSGGLEEVGVAGVQKQHWRGDQLQSHERSCREQAQTRCDSLQLSLAVHVCLLDPACQCTRVAKRTELADVGLELWQQHSTTQMPSVCISRSLRFSTMLHVTMHAGSLSNPVRFAEVCKVAAGWT